MTQKLVRRKRPNAQKEPLDVRAIRERLGLKQVEFAQRIGVSLYALYCWEKGLIRPNREHREKIMELMEEIKKS